MHHPLTLLLTLLSVAMTAAAQICLKIGVGNPQLQALLVERSLPAFLMQALISPWVIIGLLAYVLSTATWLVVLARADLSVAYPFVSLAFVATTLYGFCVLHEPIGPGRLSGIALVIGGVLLMSRS